MAKKHKHLKRLKSEKAKVKLKTKFLPKGLNVTDPSFKVKKIVIREQLKQRDGSEILSKRKLNVKDLLSRLQHHNSTVRKEAVRELKEILPQHSESSIGSQFGALLQGICSLSLDKERDIRRDSLKVLNLLLGPISNNQLNPYHDVLISYLKCAMTHIDSCIKEDSLLFLDVLMENCSSVLAWNSYKVLPNFLDMISKLHSEMKPGRQLVTTLNTKSTNIKWRIKVLERLATMFKSIVSFSNSQQNLASDKGAKVAHVNEAVKHIPIYLNANFQNCQVDFEQKLTENNEKFLNTEELTKYIELLMPLILDSWIEVCPDDKNTDNSGLLISAEALELLKSIIEIIQSIIEYIEILHSECDTNIKFWFRSKFEAAYTKNLLSKFPYDKLTASESFVPSLKSRKRQQDFSVNESYDVCLGYNLGLSQIYVWFSSIQINENLMSKSKKNYCLTIIKYLNEKLENWSNINNAALPQLTKVLRTLLLKASKIWYKNRLNLSELLQSIVNACCDQSKREMQLQLFSVISDAMLDHNLYELHRESAFKEFISTLPSHLLKPRIQDNTVQIINKIVIRYRDWIQEELVANRDKIIENAKRIEIIGSEDEKQSRLMICNLFYFLDTQIYY